MTAARCNNQSQSEISMTSLINNVLIRLSGNRMDTGTMYDDQLIYVGHDVHANRVVNTSENTLTGLFMTEEFFYFIGFLTSKFEKRLLHICLVYNNDMT